MFGIVRPLVEMLSGATGSAARLSMSRDSPTPDPRDRGDRKTRQDPSDISRRRKPFVQSISYPLPLIDDTIVNSIRAN